MRRRGLEPPPGYPGPGPQPGDPDVRCVQMARIVHSVAAVPDDLDYRVPWMLPRMLPRPRPCARDDLRSSGPMGGIVLAPVGDGGSADIVVRTAGARPARERDEPGTRRLVIRAKAERWDYLAETARIEAPRPIRLAGIPGRGGEEFPKFLVAGVPPDSAGRSRRSGPAAAEDEQGQGSCERPGNQPHGVCPGAASGEPGPRSPAKTQWP